MSVIHSSSHSPAVVDGRCAYRHHAYGVDLYCGDDSIPGMQLCASHFIEAAHYRADAGIPPATPPAVAAERDRLGLS